MSIAPVQELPQPKRDVKSSKQQPRVPGRPRRKKRTFRLKCVDCMSRSQAEVVLLVVLAFFVAVGPTLTIAACAIGNSVLPAISLFISIIALIPLFCCGLAEETMDDMPEYLRDTEQPGDWDMNSLGWFITGTLLMSALLTPILFAHTRLLAMNVAWITAGASWACILSVGLGAIMSIKGGMMGHRHDDY